MKLCRKCGIAQSLDAFNRSSKSRDGYASRCRVCSKAYGKIYAALNADKAIARAKEWARKHPERAKARADKWYADNREREVLRRRAGREATLDHERRVHATYYKANKDAVIARVNAYYDANYDKVLSSVRNAKARRRGADGKHTFKEISLLLVAQNHCCANPFCGIDLRTTKKHLDHKKPLSRGGSNWIENLQWLCATCNLSKNAKDNETWLSILAMETDADRSHNSDAAFRSGESVSEARAV